MNDTAKNNFFGISQGKVVMSDRLGVWGLCQFFQDLTCQQLLKSVNFWQSYSKKLKGWHVFGTRRRQHRSTKMHKLRNTRQSKTIGYTVNSTYRKIELKASWTPKTAISPLGLQLRQTTHKDIVRSPWSSWQRPLVIQLSDADVRSVPFVRIHRV